jgi:hypothetical protein
MDMYEWAGDFAWSIRMTGRQISTQGRKSNSFCQDLMSSLDDSKQSRQADMMDISPESSSNQLGTVFPVMGLGIVLRYIFGYDILG